MSAHEHEQDRDERPPIDTTCPPLIALAAIGLKLAYAALAEFETSHVNDKCTCPAGDDSEKNSCPSCRAAILFYDTSGIAYSVRYFANSLYDSFTHGKHVKALKSYLETGAINADPETFVRVLVRLLKGKLSRAARNRLVTFKVPTSMLTPSAN